jgi:hypothetical protein
MLEPSLSDTLVQYLRVIIPYWWIIFPGAFLPLLDIRKHLYPHSKEIPIPRWLRWTIAIICLSIAQFLAYRNSQSNLYTVIEEKKELSIKNNVCQAALDQKGKATIEIEGFDAYFDPSNKMQVWAQVHIRNIGPSIARDVHGFIAIVPSSYVRDNIPDNQKIQNDAFQIMLKDFQREKVAHGEGPSLAPGQPSIYPGRSPVLTEEQYASWNKPPATGIMFIPYLIGEVAWKDETGEWKTDYCRLMAEYCPGCSYRFLRCLSRPQRNC